MAYTVESAGELQRAYDAIFEKRPIHHQDPQYRWIADLLRLTPGASLLDVACGSGWMVYEASRRRMKAFGLDLSPKAIELARAHAPGADVRVGDGERLPWPDNTFDYVTCLGSLEHYLHPDRGVQEIARVLKADGVAGLMLPNKYYLPHIWREMRTGQAPDEQEGFERLMTRVQWQRLIAGNGLVVTRVVRQNEIKPLVASGTWKVKSLKKTVLSRLMWALCPLDLSYHFVFVCRKSTRAHADAHH